MARTTKIAQKKKLETAEDFLEESVREEELSDQAFREAMNVEVSKDTYSKVNAHIPHDLYVKLATASALEGVTQSQIVARALKKELDGLTVIDTRYRKKS